MQRLRALTVLGEDMGSVPNTYIVPKNQTLAPQDSYALFWPPQALHPFAAFTHTNTHVSKGQIFNTFSNEPVLQEITNVASCNGGACSFQHWGGKGRWMWQFEASQATQ